MLLFWELLESRGSSHLKDLTDLENVQSFEGEDWSSSSLRSRWSSPALPPSSRRNWSLLLSGSRTQKKKKTKQRATLLKTLLRARIFCQFKLVHSKIIYERSSLVRALIKISPVFFFFLRNANTSTFSNQRGFVSTFHTFFISFWKTVSFRATIELQVCSLLLLLLTPK